MLGLRKTGVSALPPVFKERGSAKKCPRSTQLNSIDYNAKVFVSLLGVRLSDHYPFPTHSDLQRGFVSSLMLTGKPLMLSKPLQAAWAAKKYRGHRVLPE